MGRPVDERSDRVRRLQRIAWTYPRATAPARAMWRWARAVRGRVRHDRLDSRRTAGLFDPDWYLADNPDVAAAGIDPHRHYATVGWREGRDPNPLFDTSWYLAEHPEIRAAGIDPLDHYARFGWREGWDPSPLFDAEWYLSEHPKAAELGLDPLLHYLDHGASDGDFVHPDHRQAVLGNSRRPVRPVAGFGWAEIHTESGRCEQIPLRTVADLGASTITFDPAVLFTEPSPDEASRSTARRLVVALAARGVTTSVADVEGRRVTNRTDPFTTEAEAIEDDLATIVTDLGVPGDGFVEALARDERARRLANLRLNVPVSSLYHELAAQRDRRVAIVADHLGEEPAAILAEHGLESAPDTAGGVDDSDRLHIGVVPQAESPASMVVVPASAPARARATRSPLASLHDKLDEAAEVAVATEAGANPTRQRVVRAAYGSSLLPTSLVAAAIEAADREQLDTVHYMSREGWFLKRVHDAISDRLHAHRRPPTAVHLAVSRRSTFGPSLTGFDPDALMDLWRMYSTQSLRALVVSLGDEPARYEAAAKRHGIGLDEVMEGIHTDERVAAFLGDRETNRMLSEHNEQRRAALTRYLESRWSTGDGRAIVVDVGWRGTIQDNLARLYPEVFLSGWYLALFPFLNPQASNVAKHAIGPDGNAGDPIGHVEPPAAVERPWTLDSPSVVDYRLEADGTVSPVEDQELLGYTQRDLIELFQQGALDATRIVADWIAAEGLLADDLRPLVREELYRYYTEPFGGVADIWFSSAHDDTFGALNVTPFGKQRPSSAWLGAGLGIPFRRRLDEAAATSQWVPGYQAWLPVAALRSLERALRTKRFSEDPHAGR